MRQIYEMHAAGQSVRAISRTLGIARNSVRKYLRAPEVPKPPPRRGRGSKLDPYVDYIHEQLARGVENCVVLLRELRAQGYDGSYTLLKNFVQPLRRRRQPVATMRFETTPGDQAQVDWGVFRYQTPDGSTKTIYAFVLVLSWSRAMYVEFVPKADVATFIRCHIHAFEQLGGIPRRCLYDNAKVVVLGRDEAGEPDWNSRFLDFALRLGFRIQLCHPYRPQTKGRVESGVKYVRGNFWPTTQFTDLADLNHQAQTWVRGIAHVRDHGTTHEQPAMRLGLEQRELASLPAHSTLEPFLREERLVGRDGFVQWERSWYGVQWPWVGQTIQVEPDESSVHLWAGDRRLAVHPRALQPGQRFPVPGQWQDLPRGDGQPTPEPLAVQIPTIDVQRRSLSAYDQLLEVAG